MPDVIIWMLKGGTQRIAYCRIPAYNLLYTPEEEQRGEHCGKIVDINLKVSRVVSSGDFFLFIFFCCPLNFLISKTPIIFVLAKCGQSEEI